MKTILCILFLMFAGNMYSQNLFSNFNDWAGITDAKQYYNKDYHLSGFFESSTNKNFTLQLSGTYSVSPKISVGGLVSLDRYSSLKIGDVGLFSRYIPFKKFSQNKMFLITVTGGFKLPVSNTYSHAEYNSLTGTKLPFGTGSKDIFIGTDFLYANKKLMLSTSFYFDFGSANNFKNNYSIYSYELNTKYKIFEGGHNKNMIYLIGGIGGQVHHNELKDGVMMNTKYINTTYLSFGFAYFITPHIKFDIQYHQPINNNSSFTGNNQMIGFSFGIWFDFEF